MRPASTGHGHTGRTPGTGRPRFGADEQRSENARRPTAATAAPREQRHTQYGAVLGHQTTAESRATEPTARSRAT